MKKAFSLALLGVLFLSVSSAGADAFEGINDRQQNQRGRLTQGVKSGELTKGETKALINGQKRVHKMEHKLKSDGAFTPKERARVQHAQNRQSRKIFKAKHNKKNRP